MVDSNVLRAVGEALEAHDVVPRQKETLPETIARTLDVSQGDAARWLEALEEGCTVEQANARIGLVSHQEEGTESFLTTLAKKIGAAAGSAVAAASSAVDSVSATASEVAAKAGIRG